MSIAISEFLRNMVQNEGPDYLMQESRVCACLADIFPKSKRERSILRMSIKMGYPSKLEQLSKDSSLDNKKAVIHKLAQEFCDEGWITSEAALYALNILAYAKGYLQEYTEPERTNVSQSYDTMVERIKILENEKILLQRQNAVLREKLQNNTSSEDKATIADEWYNYIKDEDFNVIKELIKKDQILMTKCGKLFLTSQNSETVMFGEDLLFAAAEREGAEAQLLLGELYYRNREEGKAYCWLKRSADNGNTNAAYKLGTMCGVAGRYYEAAKWFGIAADGGMAEAQLQYGIMLQSGIGIEKNQPLALYWYQKSANAGNEIAFEKYQELLKCIK